MEEIEYKLKQKNPVTITQAISKLIETIKLKLSNNPDVSVEELRTLKTKCTDENTIVALTASHGIIYLIEESYIPIGWTLSDLMISLSTTKNTNGVIFAINQLLLIDLRRYVNKQKYVCPFGITKNQHPLIMILSKNSSDSIELINYMQIYMKHYDKKISQNSVEFLRPLFYYLLCNPGAKLNSEICSQTWNLLITTYDNQTKNILIEILTWIQMNEEKNILQLSKFLIDLSRLFIKNSDATLCTYTTLFLSSLLKKLVLLGHDPTSCIDTLIEIIDKVDVSSTHSIMLFLLSESIMVTPSIYLNLFKLGKKIIQKQSCNVLSVKSLLASVMQWLLYPTNLLSDALKTAKEILLLIENNDTYTTSTATLQRIPKFTNLQCSNESVDFYYKLCLLAEKWQTDEKDLPNWLTYIATCPSHMLPKFFVFLSAIFLRENKNPVITSKTLSIFTNLVEKQNEFASQTLILILHKLSVETDPENQLELLRAFPRMAVLKENMPIILNTLEIIQNGPGCLKTYSFDLYFRLWQSNSRTFPYLNKLISENSNFKDKWEFGIAKANTLKNICVERPEMYGPEMVLHLSQILNKYVDARGSNASALVIEGLTFLCDAGVVDVVSTWKSLSPKFSKEKRPLVIKSLCGLFALFGNLRTSTINYEVIINDVLAQLWKIISDSTEPEVYEAATKALANFDLNEMNLKQLPHLYKQNLKIPSTIAKTPVDAAKKPELVLTYIPGECWVKYLYNTNHDFMKYAGNMLIEWIKVEIAEYRSGVYIVDARNTEPPTHDYLPAKSIVRGLSNYLRQITTGDTKLDYSERVVEECLRVLGQTYSKPLPPLNWCFLHELLHKSANIKMHCITLAAKQVQISGSARRLLENYVDTFKFRDVQEAKTLISNMDFLGKGIQPNILRPFLTNGLQFTYDKQNTPGYVGLFSYLVENIRISLKRTEIHDANRSLIGQIIEAFCEQMNAREKIFDDFIECLIEIEVKYVERVSTPSLWWEVQQDTFEKAVKIRCLAAIKTKEAPFVWLNECITTAVTLPSCHFFVLENICKVFHEHREHPSIGDWILELMGQIQEKLTVDNSDTSEIMFLCDVFIVAIIKFSGYECMVSPVDMMVVSREVRLSLLPIALCNLVVHSCQNIAMQMMEWLYHMADCDRVTQPYQTTFYSALTALRHEKSFSEPSRWSKYVLMRRPH